MLRLDNITFGYAPYKEGNGNALLQDFDLEIFDGEFLSLVGPSGCGKTTLVNIIAGYLKALEGTIFIDKNIVSSPGKDRVVINQENDLFEWMTVLDNMKIVSRDEKLIEQSLRLTHLLDVINYYPRQLSGGMKKRLSLARALAANPKFIIMDEPFASLDDQIKEPLREEVLKIVKQSGKTVLLVTHDVSEAIFLSDRILVLSDKPVSIRQGIKVPFPHPRSMSLMNSSEFSNLRGLIRQVINNH